MLMVWLRFVAPVNGPLVLKSVQLDRSVEACKRYKPGGTVVNESTIVLVVVELMFK